MATPPLPDSGDGAPHGGTGDEQTDESADRVGTLRGAGVGRVDTRRLGRILIVLVLATLAVLVVAFTIVGVHQNQQDDQLHSQGVPVTFTVSGCLGLLGGSGSNAAGYSCRGTYTLDGHRYSERLPGNDLHPPGTTVPAIAVPGDPALVAPAAMVRAEHSSKGVFVVPAILLLVLVLLVGLLLVLRRRRQGQEPRDGPTAAS